MNYPLDQQRHQQRELAQGQCPSHKRFYEKVIKVKADVAALLNLFSDVSIDVRW
jgi:hypothetical protein